MSRVRLAFFGTPEFARFCLEALIKDDHFEVVGVVTQPDRPSGRQLKLAPSPVKAMVQNTGIPILTPENASDPKVVEEIASWRAEVAVVVAFGQILRSGILDLFPRKIVNVHASLLPRWRGAAPIQRAIMAGDRETGVCLQVLVPRLDAGDVLGARKVTITEEMNALELHDQLKVLAAELVRVDLMDYLRGNLVATPQVEDLVTYAKKIEKAEALIDWHRSANEVSQHVRGLAMGPFAFTRIGQGQVKFHRVKVVEGQGRPGKILSLANGTIVVACGQGALALIEIQPESRSRMSSADYLKGYPLQVGDQLG